VNKEEIKNQAINCLQTISNMTDAEFDNEEIEKHDCFEHLEDNEIELYCTICCESFYSIDIFVGLNLTHIYPTKWLINCLVF